ncbi:hypothetical protein ABB37_07221 [Leptomonas pyrrhocoris]|uniref:Microcystin-dependent protein n=1 Tax=Leptomonas pyrrhocoris TaxID=157538 RepID=A0A0M9FW70_LEPPY|nr:hypothetical protein ABB37_07221 [Leptomonas pyrrhocoris]KPA77340.1 hypothetical protein ABB37_07221 [Leptomonas pyrrhocoris]|eukprot:XP_015655779.1 hypothetical protein ABB37_07221 [Leptomonas pyrrhocoris]
MAPRSLAGWSKALFLLGALLLFCSATVNAANVAAFAAAIQSALRSIAPGFVTYYSALVGAPAVKAHFCTNSILNMAPGLALTMESIGAPYGIQATAAGLVIYKDNFVYGPAMHLIGTSYRIADGSPATGVQQGNSLLMPYTPNSIVMVTGTMTSGNNTNILPLATYMILEGYLCNSMYADTTSLSAPLADLFTAFANAAVPS